MSVQITGGRLASLFRPRSVALIGASDKSTFSMIAYQNLVRFGFGECTYLVNRRGAQTHGRPTVTSCAQIGEPVDVAYLMVPQAGMLAAMDDAAAAASAGRPHDFTATPATDSPNAATSSGVTAHLL